MHQRKVTSDFSIDRVVPFFQPIIDLNTNKVWRYECLARLVTENETIFLPSEFLYIVDRKKSNCELTRRIFSQSLQYFAKHPIPWNINLSAADLSDPSTIKWLIEECRQHTQCAFGLEISVNDAIEHKNSIQSLINGCRKISIIIDDVDAVSDELQELVELGVVALKIKGSLSDKVSSDQQTADCVRALVALCKQHHAKLVAEHIEDEYTLEELKKLGIEHAQGYLFSLPTNQLQ